MKKRGLARRSPDRGIKGQVSIEFIMVVGFALMMTLPLIVIFFRQSESLQTEITGSQVDKVASEIRDAADEVYYLGSPSRKSLTLYFPDDVTNVTLLDNKIIFWVDSADGDYEIVKWAVVNLSGSIQSFGGIHRISVESKDSYVLVSDS